MDKKDAIDLFGGRARSLADALDIGEAGMSKWPDRLTAQQANRVIGAAVRKGIIKGCRLPECVKKEVEK